MLDRRFFKRARAFIGKPIIVTQQKAVVIDNKNRCKNPIFLIGVHRSGTSLTRRMFNCHRNIACPPESFFLRHYCDMLKAPLTESGYRGFGFSRAEMIQHIAQQAGSQHEAFRVMQDKARWADKTPQYTDILPELRDLFGEEARFVLIFRDPRDIAFSIHERGWRFSNKKDDILDDTIYYVNQRVQIMKDFLMAEPERACRLNYEHLVADPKTELTRVLTFLDEEFDEAMLRFGEGKHNFGTEDPMIRGTTDLRLSSQNWRAMPDETKQRLQAGLRDLVIDLGYDPE